METQPLPKHAHRRDEGPGRRPQQIQLIFSGDECRDHPSPTEADQPGLFGTTISLAIEAPDSCRPKSNGRVTIIGLWKLSPDGTTLTDNFTGYRPDGTTTNLH